MYEMSGIDQSEDANRQQSGLSRPDFFSRVAGSQISRREMVKASVVAGGLAWSAPILLSGKAAAQVAPHACCPTGTPVTIYINASGELECVAPGTVPCLPGSATFPCPDGFLECLDDEALDLISVNVNTPGADTATITVDGDFDVIAVAAQTTTDCFWEECPNFPLVGTPQITVIPNPALSVIQIVIGPFGGDLQRIALSLCLPETLTALC